MRRNKLLSLSAALLCALMALVMLPQRVHAIEADNNSLTIKFIYNDKGKETPIADAEFKIYRVATVDREKLTVTPLEDYMKYQNVFKSSKGWDVKAQTLHGYVSTDKNIEPTAVGTTNENGAVRFTGLRDGMYLIGKQNKRAGGYTYVSNAALISLPNALDYYNWTDDVTVEVKVARRGGSTPDPVERSLRALKVWDDDGHEDERPESITVDLIQDGSVIDTVELSAANNWRHDWTGLDRQAEYQVVEGSVGDSYTVSVEESGVTFVITNEWTDPTIIEDPDTPLDDRPDLPDDPEGKGDGSGEIEIGEGDVPLGDLPYTGQLWWPVPIMAGLGLLMLALGAAVRRRELADEE